ncbi:hypothetical protein KDW_33520 [Dictyobacter vulcani]|uniref:Uncharacterized protein n=1 Tax=Dictyobacter vulcani TaxID=2607529 RepID=A0A5J4KRZ9_9CHLR|nr:hypothetical protein [Dictyobacter vulcani]GER89190.1 hypothetical protein KDW_33520 [Dictyobacter vulcani]
MSITGNVKNLSTQIYTVSQASAALVWTISSAFLFICIIGCYLKNPRFFISQRHFPLPVIWLSVVVGLVSCSATIIDTLFFSWTNLLPDYQWWYLVGGLTIVFLILSAFISIFAKSEVDWQTLNREIIELTTNQTTKPEEIRPGMRTNLQQ